MYHKDIPLKYKISLANQMPNPVFLPFSRNLIAIADSRNNFLKLKFIGVPMVGKIT